MKEVTKCGICGCDAAIRRLPGEDGTFAPICRDCYDRYVQAWYALGYFSEITPACYGDGSLFDYVTAHLLGRLMEAVKKNGMWARGEK